MALSLDFAGKHVFVFGGTTGINLGIAETFARHGARVSVASRKQENVDSAVKALRAVGDEIIGVTADVRDPESVRLGLEAGCGKQGNIDVLVSGAAGNFLSSANEWFPRRGGH